MGQRDRFTVPMEKGYPIQWIPLLFFYIGISPSSIKAGHGACPNVSPCPEDDLILIG